MPTYRLAATSPAQSNIVVVWRRRQRSLAPRVDFPAVTAIRHNPPIRALPESLRSHGKARMTIVAAAMRKLLTLAYGVLKSGRALDPAFWGGLTRMSREKAGGGAIRRSHRVRPHAPEARKPLDSRHRIFRAALTDDRLDTPRLKSRGRESSSPVRYMTSITAS
jgi:hypothetical protein